MKFIVSFTNNIQLVYNLIEHNIVDEWSKLISAHTINDCCKINHYMGYASDEQIQDKIDRLYELSDIINSHVPDRVIKHPITKETYRQAFNVMHVHFPDLKNDTNYEHLYPALTEYNDIIHWLESILTIVWGDIPDMTSSSAFRITLDFNKSNTVFNDITEDMYPLFNPFGHFGALLLHYTHVGKCAIELLATNDLECPSHQFVPQQTYSASIRMYFTDYFFNTDEKVEKFNQQWKDFYDRRGGKDFFGYDIDDPKMRLGFIQIGSLEKIYVDGIELSIPVTDDQLQSFRKTLVNASIIDWEVLGPERPNTIS